MCNPALAAPCEQALLPREVHRIENAYAVSGPVFTLDRQGRPTFAYVNDTGEILAHTVGKHFPIWRFPLDLRHPFSGENEFLHLAWHINSEGTPVLVVYWIPRGAIGEPRHLYRALARLHDSTGHVTLIDLPRSGFLERVYSMGLGREFFQWLPVSGTPTQLIDLNKPAHTLNVHDAMNSTGLVSTAKGGLVLLARMREERKVEILLYKERGWELLWEQVCDKPCLEATLYETKSGELWLAYAQTDNSVVIQAIAQPSTRHTRRFNLNVADSPFFVEGPAGRLLLLVELQSESDFVRGRLLAADARHPRQPDRILVPEGTFFPESSHSFATKAGQFLGLMTLGGVEFFRIGRNQAPVHAGQLKLQGTQRVGWLSDGSDHYFAHADYGSEPHLVVYRLPATF